MNPPFLRVPAATLLVFLLGIAPAAQAECPRFASHRSGLPSANEWRTHPALGDVDGDGRLDLAVHVRKAAGPRIYLARNGHWEQAGRGIALPGMGCGVGVALGDANEDGHLDLAVADHCHGLFLFQGEGNGGFRLLRRLGNRNGKEDVQFGDLDGDGHLDLVAVGSFAGGFDVWKGDGKGSFASLDVGLPGKGTGRDVKLADLNADGWLDVVAAFTKPLGGDVEVDKARFGLVWLSDGKGGYREASEGLRPDLQRRGIALGDVDRDGKPELAQSPVPHGTDQRPLYVHRRDAGAGWQDFSEGLPERESGLSFSGVELADLDGDGAGELLALSWLEPQLRIWRRGENAWQECRDTGLVPASAEIRGWGLAVGDVNADGKPDVVAALGKRGEGRIEVWVQK